MIYILIAIIVILCIAIVCLSVNFQRTRQSHKQKAAEFDHLIIAFTEHSEENSGQLQLSDELTQKLLRARSKIDKDMLGLQNDFVKVLSKNGLIE